MWNFNICFYWRMLLSMVTLFTIVHNGNARTPRPPTSLSTVSVSNNTTTEMTSIEMTTIGDDVADCEYPLEIVFGYYYLLGGGTTSGSIAHYYCIEGFHLTDGDNKQVCGSDGIWTGTLGSCVQTAGFKAVFTCNEGFSLIGWQTVTCVKPGNWNKPFPKCEKVPAKFCPLDTDSQGTTWNQTNAGTLINIDCPHQLLGDVSRNCTTEGKWRSPKYSCINRELSVSTDKIDAVIDANTTSQVKTSVISDVLEVLLNSTTSNDNDTDRELYDGEITVVTETLEKITDISRDIIVPVQQSKDFLETTSNLLKPQNSEAFKTLQESLIDMKEPSARVGAEKIISIIGQFASAIANTIESLPDEGMRIITTDNLEMTVSELNSEDNVQFPTGSDNSDTRLTIASNFLRGASSYSGVRYNDLSKLMPQVLNRGRSLENEFEINTPVLALQLFGTSNSSQEPFEISLGFKHFTNNYSNPVCSFWNYTTSAWDASGCRLVPDRSTGSYSTCVCNHLTIFAVLMNPFSTENVDTLALDIITIAGCSFSTVCLGATLVIHLLFWRYLKSDRAVLLVNLSAALVISYVIFLVGVKETENETGCTVTAVLLHYIYLVVFLLMLSEGIEILINVVYVFPMKSRLKWLLITSWGTPAVIVGISMGATQLDGYGNNENCWLSVEGGLIWAFVGPALAIIAVNLVQLALIMRKMFTVKSIKARSNLNKVKAGIRCLCVLLPLIGCTWVIGVFYVNEEMAWIQYSFSVLNGLQGFVIMMFHCMLNPQVRLAMSRRWKQYTLQRCTPSASSNSSSNTGQDIKPARTKRGTFNCIKKSINVYNKTSSQTFA